MDAQSEKKVTINQVASYCGVSKTTISRFLNGKYENMSAETKEKISAAVKALNYRPDRSAQRLKASRTMLIGCVIGDISSPFSALLLKGITSVCEESGYQVLFADSRESARREKRALRGFLDNRVDGLIVNTCGSNDEYLLELQERGIPLVLADRPLMEPGLIDTVCSRNQENAAECTRLLLSQGYEHVAFFSETIAKIAPRELRCKGYADTVTESGAAPEIYEINCELPNSCVASLRDFLGKHEGERIAVLSANGTTTQRILTAMKFLGIKAGKELGLCTFDDWDWLQIADPGITAVALSTGEIGARAARLLLDRINGSAAETPAEEIVPSSIIIRESTTAGAAKK